MPETVDIEVRVGDVNELLELLEHDRVRRTAIEERLMASYYNLLDALKEARATRRGAARSLAVAPGVAAPGEAE